LRKWKRGKGSKEDYNRGKREYKDLCERRKEEEREEFLKEEFLKEEFLKETR